MNYNIEELKNTCDYYNNLADNIINEAIYIMTKFIDGDGDMLQRYRKYIDKNNFKENYPFNIFELISDIYYRENFHSDIIAKLFENEIILKNFLKFIGVDESLYFNEGYEVIPEYFIKHEIKNGRIDILIKSNDKDNNEDEENENKEKPHCIIIENKLNWANDEERQLFRYYEACGKNFEVDKIVYLSPNSYKKPSEDSIKEIPKELIKTIIGYDGEENDFYTMVLDKSLKEMNDNEPKEWLLLLEHYLKILRKTGVTKMDALTKKFYEKIKKEPQEYEKVKLIADMYNNLTIARVNNLVEKFSGVNYNNQCFWRNFPSEKRKTNYAIDIYIYNDKSLLYLFSREEMQDKLEQDNKNIKAWLEKHNLFKGFEKCNDIWHGWVKEFKFPEEENELYEFTEKLIKLLKEDIESIYSGK
ncbi:hypothetical protein [Brachyspira sp.]|uniref:hypothetical protein n=1 Tax=Brachyspira sp. TaxID=1977261 RepID=UPI003D7D21D9